MMRKIVCLTLGLLTLVGALAGCDRPAAVKQPKPTRTPAIPPTETAAALPLDLTPIVVNGTPVIIPSAIEFTPTPTSTGPSNAPAVIPDPAIIDFQVTPLDGLDFGRTVTVRWEVEAKAGTISYTYATGPGEQSSGDTFPLDTMKGSRQVTLRPVDALPLYVEFTLTATNGGTDPLTGNPITAISHRQAPVRCPYPWFFDNPPKWCPLSPDRPREGIVQRFEHAQMIGGGDQLTVLITQPNFWTSYNVVRTDPGEGTSGVDPMFYGQWRDGLLDNAPLKDATGGPLGAAVRYTAHSQCVFSPQSALISECFFNLPGGRVIELYWNGAYGRNGITWHEWMGPVQ